MLTDQLLTIDIDKLINEKFDFTEELVLLRKRSAENPFAHIQSHHQLLREVRRQLLILNSRLPYLNQNEKTLKYVYEEEPEFDHLNLSRQAFYYERMLRLLDALNEVKLQYEDLFAKHKFNHGLIKTHTQRIEAMKQLWKRVVAFHQLSPAEKEEQAATFFADMIAVYKQLKMENKNNLVPFFKNKQEDSLITISAQIKSLLIQITSPFIMNEKEMFITDKNDLKKIALNYRQFLTTIKQLKIELARPNKSYPDEGKTSLINIFCQWDDQISQLEKQRDKLFFEISETDPQKKIDKMFPHEIRNTLF